MTHFPTTSRTLLLLVRIPLANLAARFYLAEVGLRTRVSPFLILKTLTDAFSPLFHDNSVVYP